MKLIVLFALAFPLFSQSITSITCWGSWNNTPSNSCFKSVTAPIPSARFDCHCAATCGNANNIGAGFAVWWNLTGGGGGIGQISGGSQGTAVKVSGSALLYCSNTVTQGDSGFDKQDCWGSRTGESFALLC